MLVDTLPLKGSNEMVKMWQHPDCICQSAGLAPGSVLLYTQSNNIAVSIALVSLNHSAWGSAVACSVVYLDAAWCAMLKLKLLFPYIGFESVCASSGG